MADSVFWRSYPLEDIRILSRAQGSEYADGRTVEAYAAVFDRKTEIHDGQGHYMETIDRAAFNRAIDHARPKVGQQTWRVGVFYNHGMTIHGTPSDRFSVPLGSPVDIRAESVGLLTVTRYNNSSLADDILESIRSGDITAQSFTGRIIRSNPEPTRRGYEPGRNGKLPDVRRTELGLREYGPTPFAAYVDASILSVRSAALMAAFLSTTQEGTMTDEPDRDAERSDVDPDPVEDDTSPDEEPVPDDPPAAEAEHSSRETEDDPQRAALLQRIAVARATRPGL